ncbi:MAG: hypothetical protein WD426_15015 [Anditalea sp.]
MSDENQPLSVDMQYILAYGAGFCMGTYLQVIQLTAVLFTNGGFLIITFLFFWNMIEESKKDLETLSMMQTKYKVWRP